MAYGKALNPERDGPDGVHTFIMKRAEQMHEADFDNRAAALEDLKFKAAENDDQWPVEVQIERNADNRPMLTIDMTGKFLRQVTNSARANPPAIKVRGVDDESDPDTADVLEGIIRHIEDQSEAGSKAYIPALDNAASCGIGHWRVDHEFCEGSWGQELTLEGIPNALAVLWDDLAKDPTRCDARDCFVIEDIAEEEFADEYPEAAKSDFHSDFWINKTDKTVRIAEYWCKVPVVRTLGLTADGKLIDLTDIPAPSVKFLGLKETRKEKTHKVVQYLVSGADILDGPNEFPKWKHIPIVAVIGEEIHVGERKVRKGMLRSLKVPQFLYNLWRTLQAETLALQPKAPYIATKKQVGAYLAMYEQANRRNFPVMLYDVDPLAPNSKPERSQPPIASSAMTEEAMLSLEEMKGVSGVYDAALGNRSNKGQSGIAIENLQRESDQSNLHLPGNLALSIRQTGRILIERIPDIMDTESVRRLLNEDGSEKWATINKLIQTPEGPVYEHDLSAGKYDVTVQTGKSYATKRMEESDFLLQFIQTMPEAAQFVADLLAKNLDSPGSEELAKRFRMVLKKAHPEFFTDDEEPAPPPTQADQNNALMAHAQLTEQVAKTQLAEAQAEDAEMDAALKGMQVAQLAVQGPIESAVQAAVMKVLSDFGVSQPQGQPGPQGVGAQPVPASQPLAPMGAQ